MKMSMSSVALALCLSASAVYADSKAWTGLSTNLPPRWDDPDNWKPSPPGELDDVVIGEPPYNFPSHITVQGPIKVKSLTMNRTTLVGPAQFEVMSLVSKGAALTVGGAMKVTGTASIQPGSTGEYGLLADGWTVNNEGDLSISTNATFKFFSGAGQLNNSGNLNLTDGSSVDGLGANGSQFINSGTIRKSQGTGRATINGLQFANNGQILVSSGTLSFPSGQVLITGAMAIQGGTNATIIFEGASLDLSGGALTGDGPYVVRGGSSITVNVDTSIDILNLYSDIKGPAKLTVQTQLLWISGVMSGPGETISVTQLTIQDPPGGATRRIDGRTLRNKLYALWASGDLTVTGGGRIENELTGVFTIGDLADKQMAGSYLDTGGFFNAGLTRLIKENGRKTSFYCPLSNSNRFEYASQLLLYGGGAHAGAFVQVVSPTGKLDFLSGTNFFDQGFSSTSANFVSIKGGVVNVRGASTANRLELNGGTITGAGDFEISQQFLWSSGTISGPGVLRTLTPATFDWGANAAQRELIQRTIEIFGVGIWDQVNFSASEGAILRIMPGAELKAGSSETMQWNTGAAPTLDIQGSLTKLTGTGTCYIGVNFLNSGHVTVGQGKLQCATGIIQSSGSTQIASGAEVQTSKGFTNLFNGEVLGSGRLSGGITNSGKLRPGNSPGILTLTDLRQTASGRVEIEITGHQAGTEFDQIVVENAAILNGEIQIKRPNGFSPAVGDRFDVILFPSHTGQFTVQSGNLLNNTIALIPEYSSTKLTLVAEAITPELPSLSFVGNGSSGNKIWSWPTATGHSYQVEFTDDLMAWLFYTNLTATGSSLQLELPAPDLSKIERFYRIR